jgi:ABC-type transport system substrate-binding protein
MDEPRAGADERFRAQDRVPGHVTRRGMLKLCLGATGATRLVAGSSATGLLAALSRAAGANAQSADVTVAMPVAPGTLDTRRARAIAEQQLYFALYDPLVDLDPNVEVRARLAESWESVDPNTWRFTLRQGVKFHNGEDFTAESVKFTVEQFVNMDPPYYYIYLWGAAWPPAVEVEADDSVLIRTPEPSPILPRLMTRIGMLPQAATDPNFAEAPIGTGPFTFVEWVKGDRVVLDANPEYWDGAPRIGRLIWRTIPDEAARMAALEAGEIQLAWDPPPDRLGELTPPEFGMLETPSTGLGQMLLNFRNPDAPIADVRVRRALSLAIDGQELIDALLAGKAIPAIGPAPAACFGALDAGGYPPRDVDAARALLAEAGYADGLELTMIFTAGEFARDTEIAEAIIGQLSEIGVTVNFEELDSGQYSERRATPDWDIANNSSTGWTGDAEFFVSNVKNSIGYPSAELDRLVAEGAASGDPEIRVERLKQAEQLLWDDVPYMWSFDIVIVDGIAGGLQGVELIPTNWVFMQDAEMTS